MRDPRVAGLARVLTHYSLEIQPGQVCLIQGGTAAEPLMQALYEEILDAGAHPIVDMAMAGAQAAFFAKANDEQLEWIAPPLAWAMDGFNALVYHNGGLGAVLVPVVVLLAAAAALFAFGVSRFQYE